MQKTIIQGNLAKYLKANLAGKTKIIDSVCEISGMRSKSAIQAFSREQNHSDWRRFV